MGSEQLRAIERDERAALEKVEGARERLGALRSRVWFGARALVLGVVLTLLGSLGRSAFGARFPLGDLFSFMYFSGLLVTFLGALVTPPLLLAASAMKARLSALELSARRLERELVRLAREESGALGALTQAGAADAGSLTDARREECE